MTGLASFQNYVDRFSGIWSGIDIRVLSLDQPDGDFILGATIWLTSESLPVDIGMSQPTLPPGVKAQQVRFPLNQLPAVFSNLSTGFINVGNKDLVLGKVEASGIQRINAQSFSFEFNRRREFRAWLHPRVDWPCLIASATSDQLFNVFSRSPWKSKEGFEWELRSLQQPFRNFDDLAESFLGLGHTSGHGRFGSSFILLVAPIPICLYSCQFAGTNIQLVVEASLQADLSNLEVRMIESCVNEPVARHSTPVPSLGKSTLDLPKSEASVSHVAAYLCYRDIVVDFVEVNDLHALKINPRVVTCETIDSDLVFFKQFLSGNGKDKDADFESAIAFLLHFLGFGVAHYGQVKKYQDGIDIVAFGPKEEFVLAVECTLQEPDVKNKLSKLVRRSLELSDELVQSEVISVLFTALSRERLSKGDIERAKIDKIILLAAEDAETLLSMALRNVGPVDVRRWIYEQIQRHSITIEGFASVRQ